MMREKIIEMLSNGLPQGVIAKAVGVDDSYISQLMAQEDVRAVVVEAKTKNVEKGVKVDKLIEDIEEQALNKMSQLLPFMSKPMDIARIFTTVNNAKKRTAELTGLNQNPTAAIVNLNISVEAAMLFKLDSSKQIVEVDGRSMATLPAQVLNKQLKERQTAVPLLSDATTANQLLDRIVEGIPADSLAHVL